ncbi:hypothetical protein [Ligilactobacillus acidipiscis]|uniref:Uncharacterized protein n=1 Tax=Ligilactobacillus acidipiscis TaxID=89059 RepID=A0A1K1KSE2_9LACO|nr:hypothetical protein [Ligilactobacillus acidipiscis]GAW64465.1 hypothetical protein Lacidipiscis_01659 [Ligilactobacillus acidipiscis]GEN21227.1 hypothetical protein LAC02_45080 [Ligilactobacillus acidipiscis]SFV41785.1 hypothetical protein LAC1533_2359 [Ligilactobacillus acidipiscis]
MYLGKKPDTDLTYNRLGNIVNFLYSAKEGAKNFLLTQVSQEIG